MNDNMASHGLIQWHGTTIIGVKKNGRTVIAGDGQVSMGNTVMKPNARKVRRLAPENPGPRRSSPVSPERLRTPSPCSNGWKRSLSNIAAS